jgi:hypothetical protein
MNTYLVMFDCLVIDEPYFEFIKADNLAECWHKAYAISRRPELSEGNFEIYKHMTDEDYDAEPGFCIGEEECHHEEDC